VGANSCAQPLVTRLESVSALLTCHACRLPPGTLPSHGSSLSQWFPDGGAYCRVSTPHAQILRELGLSLLVLGMWLGNHLSCLLSFFEVPRPEASTPLPCHLLLCRPLHGHSYPWVAGGGTTQLRALLGPNPVNAQGRLTPEVGQRPRPGRSPFLLHCTPDGSYQVLTSVNARGRVDTALMFNIMFNK